MYDTLLYIDVDKAAAELCRRKFSRFVKEFWSIIVKEDLVWEPHMEILCDEIQTVYERVFLRPDPNDHNPDPKKRRMIRLPKLYDLIINIPPGLSKSTIVTIMAPVWGWTRDESLKYITCSYSDSLTTEHSVKSRDLIRSDKFKLYFPELKIKKDKDLKTNYETESGGQRFATSIGGTLTGVHAHIKTIDDPINPQQAASQAEIKNTNAFISATLSTRNIDNAVTVQILIMQRLAINDPTGFLLGKKKDNVRHICLPGELAENVLPAEYRSIYVDGLLSPRRLGLAALAEKSKDLGSSGYAGQISQRPAPEGGTIWKKWFVEVPDEMFPDINKASQVGTDWDLAYTKDEKNSASAYFKTGEINNKIYIFDFDWDWKEYPELIKWMKEVGGPHYIENKGPGKSAKQSLNKKGIIAIEVKVNRDKIARAKDATPTTESGLVYMKKSMADRLYNDPKQGILFFPNGEHNDLSDALSQMITRRTKKGMVVSGNNDTADSNNSNSQSSEPKTNPLDWLDDD